MPIWRFFIGRRTGSAGKRSNTPAVKNETASEHPPAPAEKGEPAEKQVQPLAVEAGLPKEWLKTLAHVATALWRLRRRLIDPQTNQPREETRRAYRDLEAAWDALEQAGVAIRDHTGDAYDPGYALVCLAFQPTQGLTREQVIETVKPTITIKGRPLQMGEVIVGIPEKGPGDAADGHKTVAP